MSSTTFKTTGYLLSLPKLVNHSHGNVLILPLIRRAHLKAT